MIFSGPLLVRAQQGSFSTIDVPGSSRTAALGINNAGQIVGWYTGNPTPNNPDRHGFLLAGGSFSTIDVPGSEFVTEPSGINNAGQIVGQYSAFGRSLRGFLLAGGSFSTIDVPGSSRTQAHGINNAGEIVGVYCAQTCHGFLLAGGSFSTIDVPGSSSTSAVGINNAGQILGDYCVAQTCHSFLLGPHIDHLSPVAGAVGTPVTITGQAFGTSGTVKFGATPATVISPWSDTQIVVQVPDVVAGVYGVTVTTSTGQSNAVPFQVTDIELASVIVNPPTVVGGVVGSPTGTVTLTGPAPFDVTVLLDSEIMWRDVSIAACPPIMIPTSSEVLSMQNTVVVPAGQPSATFRRISTNPVLFPPAVEIIADYNGLGETAKLTLIPPPIPSSGPEADARVQEIIDYFFSRVGGSTLIGKYKKARCVVTDVRQQSDASETGQDIYLAAAAHYLATVAVVSDSNLIEILGVVPFTAVLIPLYEVSKNIDLIENLARQTDQPTSPPTFLSVKWGWKGIFEGLKIRFGPQSVAQLQSIEVTMASPVDIRHYRF